MNAHIVVDKIQIKIKFRTKLTMSFDRSLRYNIRNENLEHYKLVAFT